MTREPWKSTFKDGFLLRQSIYSRLAGYEDVNDAERLFARSDVSLNRLGEDVGRVLEIGQQVGLRVGARVALPIGRFVWRERMVFPATDLIVLPEDADPRQLAMVSINPPTAHLLLEKFLELHQGDWIAMNAANSSIARWIIGFAKRKGFKNRRIGAPR